MDIDNEFVSGKDSSVLAPSVFPTNETIPVNLIQCCQCGTLIAPNPASMCTACLRSEVDITDGIPRQGVLNFCPKCMRFLQPPNHWVSAGLESKELLSMCLKRLKGLNKVRLIDAGFVWTEAHSRRIKIRLVIQAEVLNGAIAQQSFEVEFVMQTFQCEICTRSAAKDFWRAIVQLRQYTDHPKTVLFLEQLILKHNAHKEASFINKATNGLDFFFSQKQEARRLVDFLAAHSPSRCQTSEQLVSHDSHSNTFSYKHTFCVEVAPVCRDDVVCLPKGLAAKLGTLGQFCVVYRVTDKLHLVDPVTCRIAEVNGKQYWQTPFQSIVAGFSSFTVTNIELSPVSIPAGSRQYSQKHAAADVWLLPDSDITGEEVHSRSHLGHVLNCGDSARGVDFRSANINHIEVDKISDEKVPDVVLVRKIFADRSKRRKQRQWKLKHIQVEQEQGDTEETEAYQAFLEDLEEDTELRKHVNVYKDAGAHATEEVDEELPQISLEEMLDELNIDDVPMD